MLDSGLGVSLSDNSCPQAHMIIMSLKKYQYPHSRFSATTFLKTAKSVPSYQFPLLWDASYLPFRQSIKLLPSRLVFKKRRSKSRTLREPDSRFTCSANLAKTDLLPLRTRGALPALCRLARSHLSNSSKHRSLVSWSDPESEAALESVATLFRFEVKISIGNCMSGSLDTTQTQCYFGQHRE